MTYEEFSKMLGGGWKTRVNIKCQKEACENTENVQKGAALKNFTRNDNKFLCRKCSFTEDGKQKISKATSYKRSESTKQKMSETKLKFYQTENGLLLRKIQSRLTSEQHGEGKFRHGNHIKGWMPSKKSGEFNYFGSSYELRCQYLLDNDPLVKYFKSQVSINLNDRSRCLDLIVEYVDGAKKVLEVKPFSRLNEAAIIDQVKDSSEYALENNCSFAVWTEKDSGLENSKEITYWAEEYILNELKGVDYASIRKKRNLEKSIKHYNESIKTDTVTYMCDFCGEEHEQLKLTFERNKAKGKPPYCPKLAGQTVGKRPGKKKENPYAIEGKKQCCKCLEIKDFSEFSPDSSKSDGYCRMCKKCRREISKLQK